MERHIRTAANLKKSEVAALRPTHTQPYPRVTEFCESRGEVEQRLPELPWDGLVAWCFSFSRNLALTGGAEGGVPATGADAGREDQTGFEEGTE